MLQKGSTQPKASWKAPGERGDHNLSTQQVVVQKSVCCSMATERFWLERVLFYI